MNFNTRLLSAKRLCDKVPRRGRGPGLAGRGPSIYANLAGQILFIQEPPRKGLRLVWKLPLLPGWLQLASPTGFARRHPANYSRRALGVKRHLPVESIRRRVIACPIHAARRLLAFDQRLPRNALDSN